MATPPYSEEDREKYLVLFRTAFELLTEKKFSNLEQKKDAFNVAVENSGNLVKPGWAESVIEQAGNASVRNSLKRVRSVKIVWKLLQNAENREPLGS